MRARSSRTTPGNLTFRIKCGLGSRGPCALRTGRDSTGRHLKAVVRHPASGCWSTTIAVGSLLVTGTRGTLSDVVCAYAPDDPAGKRAERHFNSPQDHTEREGDSKT